MGHIGRNCPDNKPREGNQAQKPKVRCYRCNLLGHVASKCRVDLSKKQEREAKTKQNVKNFEEKTEDEEMDKEENHFLDEAEEEEINRIWQNQ